MLLIMKAIITVVGRVERDLNKFSIYKYFPKTADPEIAKNALNLRQLPVYRHSSGYSPWINPSIN